MSFGVLKDTSNNELNHPPSLNALENTGPDADKKGAARASDSRGHPRIRPGPAPPTLKLGEVYFSVPPAITRTPANRPQPRAIGQGQVKQLDEA